MFLVKQCLQSSNAIALGPVIVQDKEVEGMAWCQSKFNLENPHQLALNVHQEIGVTLAKTLRCSCLDDRIHCQCLHVLAGEVDPGFNSGHLRVARFLSEVNDKDNLSI